jgi:hypothetical protein
MENYHHIWLKWAKMLHLWGVDRLGYVLLSEIGGLSVFLSQGFVFLEPLLTFQGAGENYRALRALVEDEHNREVFLQLLHEQEGNLA